MQLLSRLLMGLGVIIVLLGIRDWRNNSEPAAEPVPVDLARIESGEEPASKYWKIGPHVTLRSHAAKEMYAPSIYRSRANDGPTLALYYPIVSVNHPYLTAKPTMQEVGGELISFAPKLKTFSVVMKIDLTPQVPADDAVYQPKKVDGLQGVVLGRASEIDGMGYFKKEYPELDLAKVWVLEKGSEPSMIPRRLIVFGLGLAAFIGGALMWRDKDDAGAPPSQPKMRTTSVASAAEKTL